MSYSWEILKDVRNTKLSHKTHMYVVDLMNFERDNIVCRINFNVFIMK